MKKYNNYKNSGIEWIGEIPEHWETILFKRVIFKIKDGTHGTFQRVPNGHPFLSAKNVYDDGVKIGETESYISEKDFLEITKNGFPLKNDLLITCVGTIGRTFVYDFDKSMAFQRSVTFIRFNNGINPQFYKYYVQSSIYQNLLISLAKTSAQSGIYMGDLMNTTTLKIPNLEQTLIANYLDHKTTQIDTLIAKKEQFITLLQEERIAVINQAVTKGLDPTVPMKDSGIEWLGEIPEHWEVKKLKYFAEVVLGKMLTNEDKGNYQLKKYLRAKNIEWSKPNTEDVKEMWFSSNEMNNFRVKKNDLLVSEGGEVGRTCIWNDELDECYIQNSVHKVTINNGGDSNYFLNQFILFGKLGHFDAIVNRISIAHLTKEKLKDVSFFYPPIEEQKEIANHIDYKTSEIETIISKSQQEIELLKEYKTALISEVVTGKVDVREEIVI